MGKILLRGENVTSLNFVFYDLAKFSEHVCIFCYRNGDILSYRDYYEILVIPGNSVEPKEGIGEI